MNKVRALWARRPRFRTVVLGDAETLVYTKTQYRVFGLPFAVSLRVRAFIARFAYVAAAAGIFFAVWLVANHQQQPRELFSLPGTSGVVVIDVSGSTDPFSKDIGETLQVFMKRYGQHRRFGLILFSDTACEMFDPRLKAEELQKVIPYFLYRSRYVNRQSYLANIPFINCSGGTTISSGLRMARSTLLRAGVSRGTVVLISDLANSVSDDSVVADVLGEYAKEGFSLRVLGLNPTPSDREFFEKITGGKTFVLDIQDFISLHTKNVSFGRQHRYPIAFLALTGLLAVFLAAHARKLPELSVPETNTRNRR